jgi:uromodulin
VLSVYLNECCAFCISQLILFYWTFTAPRECSNYTLLDNKDRNIKYRGGSLLCDKGISTGWYRFGGHAGTQLSTTCVPRNRNGNKLICRAHVVSWLNGTHPSVSDGKVTRTVCFSWSKCCSWKKDIEVLNCGFFYIYKLVSIRVCYFRYCGTDVWILKWNKASKPLLKLIGLW